MASWLALLSGFAALIGGLSAVRGRWPLSTLFFAIASFGWSVAYRIGGC